jgi:mannose-6-phosphate isomerase-like protein (cupin superfamily)
MKEALVPGVETRSFDSPDETRTPDKTKIDMVQMGTANAARFTLEPGWSWADCIKPIAGTESCQQRHVGVALAGAMRIAHDDGTEVEIRPGQAYVIEPGHNASVVSDEPFVGFEFDSRAAQEFAKP